MTAAGLIRMLKTYGVELHLEGADLRYKARSGAMTPQFKAQVTAQREAVVLELQRRAAGACSDCGAENMTVLLELSDGSFLCRRCYVGEG